MVYEFRLWVPLDAKLNLDKLISGARPEQRTDLYLAMDNPAFGVKIRNWRNGNDVHEGSRVEVKVRASKDDRGVEKWDKLVVRVNELHRLAPDGLIVPEGPVESWPWVQCRKARCQRWTGHVLVEQTNCELVIKDAQGLPSWHMRSICIEGEHPQKIYDAAAKIMGLGTTGDWEASVLQQQLGNTGFVGGYPSLIKVIFGRLAASGLGMQADAIMDVDGKECCGYTAAPILKQKKEEARCEWCHGVCTLNGGQFPAPGKGQQGSWCSRCVAEYRAWHVAKHTCPSGLLIGCTDAISGKTLLLFGLERSGKWCHFNGNNDPGDCDNVMVACRETAEETCYALGAPRYLKEIFFDAGKVTPVFGGAWLADMGVLNTAEQDEVLRAHRSNKNGALWRQPKRCELEMTRLQWCEAREFLNAVDHLPPMCCKKGSLTIPSLGSRFRRWTIKYYVGMSKTRSFREFCLKADATTEQPESEMRRCSDK
eukprot:gnl/MRDRNA2_/MRDRNA2_103853_c0_seq1.p1 gnl/MRDRNA2_/MRDRNA2_103853_c0~~gnl/MRDRNA2_/MRDRNA2_103853_c0_seq1.p1  ORF type:complete len:481 (-),score=78.65 gnl/MRDRNA2_/MRDRNA2_103853_c0_seq1:121-1563(-)